MIDLYSKYDNMQKNGMFNALIYINNRVISGISYILSIVNEQEKIFASSKYL